MSHAELLRRHRAVLPSWLTLYYEQPIALVDGQGCRAVDAEGKRYLDFFGGILTTMVGYNLPEVVEAVREQAGRMVHTSTLYLIEPMIELAERIAGLSGIPDAKVFFTNSGTEANEAALLFATTARRSNQVLALRNSYHGRSFAAMGITGNRGWSASSLTPVNVSYVHGGYRYRSPFRDLSDPDYVQACVDDLGHVVARHGGEDAAEEVEVAVALAVGDMAALAVDQLDGLVVEQGEPVRHHASVPGEEVGVFGHGYQSPALA